MGCLGYEYLQTALMTIPVRKIYLFVHLFYIIVIICYNPLQFTFYLRAPHFEEYKKFKRTFELSTEYMEQIETAILIYAHTIAMGT